MTATVAYCRYCPGVLAVNGRECQRHVGRVVVAPGSWTATAPVENPSDAFWQWKAAEDAAHLIFRERHGAPGLFVGRLDGLTLTFEFGADEVVATLKL